MLKKFNLLLSNSVRQHAAACQKGHAAATAFFYKLYLCHVLQQGVTLRDIEGDLDYLTGHFVAGASNFSRSSQAFQMASRVEGNLELKFPNDVPGGLVELTIRFYDARNRMAARGKFCFMMLYGHHYSHSWDFPS